MTDAEVVRELQVDEIVHAGRVVPLLRQWLRLPATESGPPLAIERTVRPRGPSRPPVILVHGFAQNRYTWRVSERSLVGRLAEEGFDVLNLELRGHGNSRRYGAGNAQQFDEYVDDLVRVCNALDQPAFAIGHSLGGAVIVGASTRTPMRGLIHLAGIYTFARHNQALRAVARLSLRLRPLLLLPDVRLSTGWAGHLISELYSLTDIAGYGLPFAGWAPGSIERHLLEERLTRGFDWTSVEVWLQMARWARGEPLAYAEAFSGLDVPLMVMAGDHDALAPPGDARSCFDGSGSTDKHFVVMEPFEHQVHWGHIDLILGRKAPEETWPRMVQWLSDRS